MKRISRDLDAYVGMKIKYKELGTTLDSLQQHIYKLSIELKIVSYKLQKEIKEGEAKDLKLIKAYKLADGYNDLAKAKTYELLQMQKWRGRYYALGAVKLGIIVLPIAGFIVGTYLILEVVK